MKAKALALIFGLTIVLIGIVSVAPSAISYSPVDVEVTNVNARSFSVAWTSVFDEEGRLDWKETGMFSPDVSTMKEEVSSTLHNMLLTGLDDNTAHSFTIWSNGIEYGDSDEDGDPSTGYAKEGASPWCVMTPAVTPEDTYVFGHAICVGAVQEASIVKILLDRTVYESTVDPSGNFAIDVRGAEGEGIIWFEDAYGSVLYSSDTHVYDSPQDLGGYDLNMAQEDPGTRVAEASRDMGEICGPMVEGELVSVTDECSDDASPSDEKGSQQGDRNGLSTIGRDGIEDTEMSGAFGPEHAVPPTEKIEFSKNMGENSVISDPWLSMEYAINGDDIVDFSNGENKEYLSTNSGSSPTFSTYYINEASKTDHCCAIAARATVTY